MTLRWIWTHEALGAWYHLRGPAAAAVDAAVLRYAEIREGTIRREPPYDRLVAGAYEMSIVVDEDAGTLTVIDLYRARR